ncbi:hypothetical protein E2562_010877 [Oryza meyeriana var. granulata]|uniref:Uncharacterized protein n=1 Tax=Oryza meyeriana var. granulata TaxID=110450 RepID=A0A6G1BUS6_9ORYZ|nr:hypothetical protein E2562_010877 [Oryza meyeriana var. granulata]
MPSHMWHLARAACGAAARAATACLAAASTHSHDGRGAANHPPPQYHLVSDDASSEATPVPSEFNDEEAYLPPYLNKRRPGAPLFNLDIRSDKEWMPFDEKDLGSDQTLWALYLGWCSYFNVKRSGVLKRYRFKIFKEEVSFRI